MNFSDVARNGRLMIFLLRSTQASSSMLASRWSTYQPNSGGSTPTSPTSTSSAMSCYHNQHHRHHHQHHQAKRGTVTAREIGGSTQGGLLNHNSTTTSGSSKGSRAFGAVLILYLFSAILSSAGRGEVDMKLICAVCQLDLVVKHRWRACAKRSVAKIRQIYLHRAHTANHTHTTSAELLTLQLHEKSCTGKNTEYV